MSDTHACKCIESDTQMRCPVQFVHLSIIIHPSALTLELRRGTRVMRIHPRRRVGRCQLTRNAPFSGGLENDICTWHNFVNNDVSAERISRESILDVKKIVPHIRQPCANLTTTNKMGLRAFIAPTRISQSFRSNFRFNDRY